MGLDRRAEAWQSEVVDKYLGGAHDSSYDLIRRLGEELVPYGGAPTCFVLAAGFLLASYSIDALRAAVEAGRSTPEERRAEIRDALVSAAERRREAAAPQTERTTGQPAPRRPVGEGRE